MECANANSRNQTFVLGDALVREPRQKFENRSEPFCRVEDLLALVERIRETEFPHRAGHLQETERRETAARLDNLARHAARIRVGADSPPETRMRLAFADSRLPEPALQYPIMIDGRVVLVLDMAYPFAKIAISYDGSPHHTSDAHARDSGRNNVLTALGWRHFQATRADLRNGLFRSLTAYVADELRRHP